MNVRANIVIGILVTILVTACGGGGNGSKKENPSNNGSTAAPQNQMNPQKVQFDCDGETCDSSTQYCLLSKIYGRELTLTRECSKLPDSCSTCSDCIYDDARKHFPTSNNCDSGVLCIKDNSKITVTCISPGI